jgi:hypothetical protein
MPLRLATLLTAVLLAIPSWGGETKVAQKQRGKVAGQDDKRARATQQQTYVASVRAQCQALDPTPNCSRYQAEQGGQRSCEMEFLPMFGSLRFGIAGEYHRLCRR